MKRPAAAENTLKRIAAWRRLVPDMTLRSTFIVGFPGETAEDFDELLGWLEAAQLDRVGCFEYSAVAGAVANELPDAVAAEVKRERYQRFMEVAARISTRRLAAKVGRSMQVLVDSIDGDVAVARSAGDAPEIDGTVRVRGAKHLKAGDWAQVTITAAAAYDLDAKLEA